MYDGQKATATVVGADALTDLAVLTINASVAPEGINFGDSDRMRPGEEVLAIGNPLGLDFSRSVTQGIVSATGRSISVDTSDGEWELDVLQTDAAINPGNSGADCDISCNRCVACSRSIKFIHDCKIENS